MLSVVLQTLLAYTSPGLKNSTKQSLGSAIGGPNVLLVSKIFRKPGQICPSHRFAHVVDVSFYCIIPTFGDMTHRRTVTLMSFIVFAKHTEAVSHSMRGFFCPPTMHSPNVARALGSLASTMFLAGSIGLCGSIEDASLAACSMASISSLQAW